MPAHPASVRASAKQRRRQFHARRRLLGKPPIAPGQPATQPEADPGALQLPHERDQSAGADATQAAGHGVMGEKQQAMGQRARQDLAEGQVDTDLRATAGLDAERRTELLDAARIATSPKETAAPAPDTEPGSAPPPAGGRTPPR